MITLCGNFANHDLSIVNGQVTKTRNIAKLLDKYGKEKIKIIDTSKGKIRVFFQILKSFFMSKVFMLCVSRNGAKTISPIVNFLKKMHKKTKTIFFCIGTCPLPQDYIIGRKLSKKELKIGKTIRKFDVVCPETKVLGKELQDVFELKNVYIFKNYQLNKKIITPKDIDDNNHKYVFFSRICDEKNIEKLFEALDLLEKNQNCSPQIDFYGPIDETIKERFFKRIEAKPNCAYKGILDNNECTETLCQYKALIFTTKCLEGTPGAIIDASFANLPVISQWFWASDELIIEPGIGIVDNDIEKNLTAFSNISNDNLLSIKTNSFNFAKTYSEEAALDSLTLLIEN